MSQDENDGPVVACGGARHALPDVRACHPSEGEFNTRLRDEKLAAMAELAAGAGHEINNPLATILICAQRLQQGLTDPEQQRLLATIGGQALRIRDMIGDLMLFARPPAPRPEAIDVSAVIADVLLRFQDQLRVAGISAKLDAPQVILIQADPTQLRVVISELLRNSIEAQPEGGAIDVECRATESGTAMLRISDSGSGLDDITRQHLFDPFFSGRQAGRGLGFGLCKVWRIVTQHRGRIEVAEPESGGLAITIHWPLPQRA